MIFRRSTFPAAIALGVTLLASAAASAGPKKINPAEIAPTQTSLGYEVAADNLRKWEKAAREEGISLEKYARKVLVPKFAKNKTAVILDPDGRVRAADGHHKIWALQKLQRDLGVEIPVHLDVLKDYRDTGRKKYAADAVVRLGLRLPEGQSPAEAIESLPRTFAGLKNDPMRSLVGKAFKSAELKGSWFENYIQFDVASRLLSGGLLTQLKKKGLIPAGSREVPESAAADPQVLQVVQSMIFDSKEMRKLLEKSARKEIREDVKKQIKKARADHRARPAPERSARRVLSPGQRSYVHRLRRSDARPGRATRGTDRGKSTRPRANSRGRSQARAQQARVRAR